MHAGCVTCVYLPMLARVDIANRNTCKESSYCFGWWWLVVLEQKGVRGRREARGQMFFQCRKKATQAHQQVDFLRDGLGVCEMEKERRAAMTTP